MRSICVLLACALVACTTASPRGVIDTPYGRVRAADVHTAQRVAEALGLTQRVRSFLDSERADLPEIWVVDRLAGGSRYGICFAKRIELFRAAFVHVDYYVAHELVHWYAHDSPFARLPVFVEEGLADYIALRLTGLHDARVSEHRRMGGVSFPPDMLHADKESWGSWSFEDCEAATRLGFEVVSVLGLEGLLEFLGRGASALDYAGAAARPTHIFQH